MKSRKRIAALIALTAGIGGLALSGCASGNPGNRSEYADANFGSESSRKQARAAEIRKLHSNLTEEQVQQKLLEEFPAAGTARK